MIVLVCGGRDYSDRQKVWFELSRLEHKVGKPFRGLIHGAASGADTHARDWQGSRIRAASMVNCGLPKDLWCAGYPANWTAHGRAAGPIRNQHMLDQNPGVELVVAFPGGAGTADMVRRAKAKGIKVVEIT